MERHPLGALVGRAIGARQSFHVDGRVHDLRLVAEAAVVVADRLQAVRARRQDRLRRRPPADRRCCPWPAPGTCTRCRCAWPGRPCSAPSPARRTSRRLARRISKSDRSDFWKSASNAPAQPSQTSTSWRAASNVSRLAPSTNFCRWSAPSPQMFPRRSRLLYTAPRYAGASPFDVRPAARPDDQRQVLDAHRALVLAGAAGRALPEHLLAVELAELAARARPRAAPPASAGPASFGLSSLPAPHAGTVHLAASALHAREGVEHDLAAEILHRFEPDFLLLEVQVRHGAELGRLQEHGDRREDEVQVLRRRDQRQEREDHEHVHPPVHAPAPATPRRRRKVSRNVTIRVAMKPAIDDRFDRDVRAETGRPDEHAPDEQIDDAQEDGQRRTAPARADTRRTTARASGRRWPRPARNSVAV